MGLRYRKSVKIAPGVKINFNKKSASVTVGSGRVHHTVNTNGRKTTSVNLPVKGLSYTGGETSRHSASKSRNKVSVTPGTASATNCNTTSSVVPSYKIKAVVSDIPGKSELVIGAFFLIFGLCCMTASPAVGFILWGLSAFYFYDYFSYKKHPEKGNRINADGLLEWQSLLSSDAQTVSELSKLSRPVLSSLKEETKKYYDLLSGSNQNVNKKKYSDLLLSAQQQIVAFSKFVVIKGDKPEKDLELYQKLIEEMK